MVYRLGAQKLNAPETGSARTVRTPHQVVPWRDVAETCRTLDAICSLIPTPPTRVVDGIARIGFWGAVFLERWPDCDLLLNEEDEVCVDLLQKSFPKARVESNDLNSWVPDKSDLLLLDFDAFTLRKLDQHRDILNRLSSTCHSLIIAESACFGFKFGNLRHYNVQTEREYYYLLDKSLAKTTGKRVAAVSKFMNAAMVLFDRGSEGGKSIKFIEPTSLPVSRGGIPFKHRSQSTSTPKGLGLWDGMK